MDSPQALLLDKLNKITDEMDALSKNIGAAKKQYTVGYAKAFIAAKSEKFLDKVPSDETAKQIALASSDLEPVIEAFYDFTSRESLLIEMARNIRKTLDVVKQAEQENNAVNARY